MYLNRVLIKREVFDPTNQKHLESFKVFIKTGNWGGVQFECEHPYEDVPSTVMMKHAEHVLGMKRETALERASRLATMNLVKPEKSETREEKLARYKAAEKYIQEHAK